MNSYKRRIIYITLKAFYEYPLLSSPTEAQLYSVHYGADGNTPYVRGVGAR